MCDISAVHLAALSLEIILTLTTMREVEHMKPNWYYWRNRVLHFNSILQKYR